MRNHGESNRRRAQEGKQIGKSRNHEATPRVIGWRKQDGCHFTRPIEATLETMHATRWPSKDDDENFPIAADPIMNLPRKNSIFDGDGFQPWRKNGQTQALAPEVSFSSSQTKRDDRIPVLSRSVFNVLEELCFQFVRVRDHLIRCNLFIRHAVVTQLASSESVL